MTVTRNDIQNEYFDWMVHLVSIESIDISKYSKLLKELHRYEFTYIIPMDNNRYQDGINLRYRFLYLHDLTDFQYLFDPYPCSVLEMMVALALKCEENILSDPDYGDRTAWWFWDMVHSLGLSDMTNDIWDEKYVDQVIERFLERKYKRNGDGGLFIVRRKDIDMRKEEIWYQLCWHINEMEGE